MNTEQKIELKSNKRELITGVLREECGNAFECLLTIVERAVISPETTSENWEAFTKEKCKKLSDVVEDAVFTWIYLNSPLTDEKLQPMIRKYQEEKTAL